MMRLNMLSGRLDLPRALILLVAGALGGAAAVAVSADTSMAGSGLAALVFAAAFGLFPSPGRWTDRRRSVVGAFTSASIVAGLILVVTVGARAACGCGGGTLPTVLGIESPTWMDIGIFGIPLLVALAASTWPDRFSRAAAPS